MLHLSWQYIIILFSSGLLAGTVDAIAGGGGLITLPLLIGVGLPAPVALGTNKLQAMIGTSAATFNYFKNRLISLEVVLKGLLFGFLGATSGSLVAQHVNSSFLELVIPFIMLLVFLYTLYSPKLGLLDGRVRMPEQRFYMLFGFLLGFYDGFLGPGTGSFWVIALVFFLGYNLAKATAYTKIFNLKSNVIATCWFMLGHNLDYKVGFIMALGQMIGGKLGSQLVIKNGAQFVRPVFLGIVLLAIFSMFYRQYYEVIIPFAHLAGLQFAAVIAIGVLVILAIHLAIVCISTKGLSLPYQNMKSLIKTPPMLNRWH